MPPAAADNSNNKNVNRFPKMPFGDLLSILLHEGFIVDVKDFAEFTAVFRDLPPEQYDRLKYYLAPLICRNKNEQDKFYQVFDNLLESKKSTIILKKPPIITVTEKKSIWKHLKDNLQVVVLVLVLLAYVISRLIPKPPNIERVRICKEGNIRQLQPSVFKWNCDTVVSNRKATRAVWNFGDGAGDKEGDSISYSFNQSGEFPIKLKIYNKRSGKLLGSDSSTVKICPPFVSLINQSKEKLTVGDSIKIIVADSIHQVYEKEGFYWIVSNPNSSLGTPAARNDTIDNNQLELSFKSSLPGTYSVSFHSKTASCPGNSISTIVESPNTYSLMNQAGVEIPKEHPVNPDYVYLLCGLSILLVVASGYFFSKDPPHLIDRSDFEGMEGPAEIPFLPKNHLIVRIPEFSRLTNRLNQRTESENPFLDINKTITQTVQHYGLITPTFKNRQKEREYLIIIENDRKEIFIQLFKYLVRVLINDNICLNYYYFNTLDGGFYVENSKQRLTFSQLKEKHHASNLIYLGTGNSLIHSSLPIINPELEAGFAMWSKRIIVTPMPQLDWSSNERILASTFNLLPADIEGLLQIVQFINEEKSGLSSFSDKDLETYRSKNLEIANKDELMSYFDGDKELYQWICGICIHHKIRWEVIVAIGKTILGAKKALHKLNYTNLLKIARINWVMEGSIPTSLRLSLLGELTEENELLARQTMIELLKESDHLIGKNNIIYEEKLIQKYTDSFVLYANNKSKNETLKDDAQKFLSLWKSQNINDVAIHNYLENKNNLWETPLRSATDPTRNIGINQFLGEPVLLASSGAAEKLAWWLGFTGVFFLVLLVCFWSSSSLRNLTFNSRFNDTVGFIKAEDPLISNFLVRIMTDSCYDNFKASNDPFLDVSTEISINRIPLSDLMEIRFDKEWVEIPIDGIKNSDLQQGMDFTLQSGDNQISVPLVSGKYYQDLYIYGGGCKSSIDSPKVEFRGSNCIVVGFEEVAGLKPGSWYYSTDMKNGIGIYETQIWTNSQGDKDYKLLNKNIKKCTDKYTFYIMPRQVGTDVNNYYADSLVLAFSNYAAYNFFENFRMETSYLLFDPQYLTNKRSEPPKEDRGQWDVPEIGSLIITGDGTIRLNEALYKTNKIVEDHINQCSIYSVLNVNYPDSNKYIILKKTGDGNYVSIVPNLKIGEQENTWWTWFNRINRFHAMSNKAIPRILWINDNLQENVFEQNFLENSKYKIDRVNSNEAAKNMLLNNYDLIVCDLGRSKPEPGLRPQELDYAGLLFLQSLNYEQKKKLIFFISDKELNQFGQQIIKEDIPPDRIITEGGKFIGKVISMTNNN